jgi:arsenate reductase (thioredoxin)
VPPVSRAAPAPKPPPAKKRVLFVCIGNAIRSQFAEAFARVYGSDVAIVSSAGVSPATMIAPNTRLVLAERNIPTDTIFPKGLESLREPVDIVVNMSGRSVTLPGAKIIEWNVADPLGEPEAAFRQAAAQIEDLVMRLILELRSQ